MTLILTRNDVMSALTMKDCMNFVENAFAELSKVLRYCRYASGLRLPKALLLFMPV
jgi:ornithine cyclodeaminase/alanine dehydrogenase-like protein (mu-crystallin family)